MSKKVTTNSDGRKQLLNGINIVSDAVRATLGARGRNVIIERDYGNPHITKDGVTVARSIDLYDPIENMGALLIKEVANKTVEIAGDGTTTATILAQAIINAGVRAVDAGCNPIEVKLGIEKASKSVVDFIKSVSKSVEKEESIRQIATISANNDSEIGQLISDAYSKIGRQGLITVDQNNTSETKIDIVEGMQLNRGYLSPFFVTNEDKMEAVLINPYILICDKKISLMRDILSLLDGIAKEGSALLIIAEDVEGEALATLVVNKLRNILSVAAIKAPEFGDNQKIALEDIAVLTNGEFVSEEKGLKLEAAQIGMMGRADKVVITKDKCTIIGGRGSKDKIAARCEAINNQISDLALEYDKEKAAKRLARLKNGVAVLSVGGFTETEIKEKKDRVDDALCATKAAIDEGFVCGGGTTFLFASTREKIEYETIDEKVGIDILLSAIKTPFEQILKNGGVDPADFKKDIIDKGYGYGLNIKTKKIENLLKSGVIDPTKVLRVALENAVSIAGIFLTTECIVSKVKTNTNEVNATTR